MKVGYKERWRERGRERHIWWEKKRRRELEIEGGESGRDRERGVGRNQSSGSERIRSQGGKERNGKEERRIESEREGEADKPRSFWKR